MGITTLRRRHNLVEVAVVDERVPTELEKEQTLALANRDVRASKVEAFKAEHDDWEQFDAESDEGKELAAHELAAQEAEDELTEATNAAEDERRQAELDAKQKELDDARPAKSAPVADWREFVVKFGGVSEDDAAKLTKADAQKITVTND